MSPLLAKRLSDESLGSRLASGEAAAFDELYRRYVHRLAAYGAHLLGDGAAGEDVAQATMLKAYGALRDGRVPDRMKPWLYRIAHNVAIDLVVRRREWPPTAELPERGSTDPAPIAGALVAALAALPERQRRVYILRELHGLRIDETAAELSLSATQVEQSLFAARNRLAEHLVFGDRLTCVSVQRLAAGPLDRDERRALKSHLRSCSSCRNGLGLRGRALGAPPVTLEWLRGLLSGALGGGAPVAAKIGAAVATVSFAAGVPAAVETVQVHPLPVRATPIVHVTPVQPTRAHSRPDDTEPTVASVAFSHASAGGHEIRHGRRGGSDDSASVSSATTSGGRGGDGGRGSGEPTRSQEGHGGEVPTVVSSSGGSGSDDGSRQSGGGPGPSTTTVTTAVVATPAPTGNDGPGSGGSGSGGRGSGDSGSDSSGGDLAIGSGSDGGSSGSTTTTEDGSGSRGGGSDGSDSGSGSGSLTDH